MAKANLTVLDVHRAFAVQFGSGGIVGLNFELGNLNIDISSNIVYGWKMFSILYYFILFCMNQKRGQLN